MTQRFKVTAIHGRERESGLFPGCATQGPWCVYLLLSMPAPMVGGGRLPGPVPLPQGCCCAGPWEGLPPRLLAVCV